MKQHLIKHLLICGVLCIPLISRAQTSTFDTGDEGWTKFDNCGQLVQWLGSGGNPGGLISLSDICSLGNAWFEAPAKFLGNQSQLYGGRFQYDIRTEFPGVTAPGDFTLELIGGTNVTLRFPLKPLEGRQWTTVTVPFVSRDGWQLDGGTNASEDDLRAVLADLRHLRRDADLVNGLANDITSLDNVILLPGDGCLGDFNGDNQVTVDEILTSVTNALNDCPAPLMIRGTYDGQGQEILSGECSGQTGLPQTLRNITLEVASQNGSVFGGSYSGQASGGASFTIDVHRTVDATGTLTTGTLSADATAGRRFTGSFTGRVVGNTIVLSYSRQSGACNVVGSAVGIKAGQ